MAADAVNIERLITITVSPGNLETVRHLVGAHPRVYGTQGIHPHEADNWHDGLDTDIREAMQASPNRLLAIGEIGLDYHYDFSDPETQKAVFRKQLQMASDLDKPVVIHTREADEDTIEILKEFEGTLKQRGVVHSFTSGEKLARYALEQGWYIGFNGICTFKTAENVREIIDLTPADRILLETDSPFWRRCPIVVRKTCLTTCHSWASLLPNTRGSRWRNFWLRPIETARQCSFGTRDDGGVPGRRLGMPFRESL